jgi:2-dehydropantoate 2-reductase
MPDAKPSPLLDHEVRRVSDIDVINGAVPRQGAHVGVEAPGERDTDSANRVR